MVNLTNCQYNAVEQLLDRYNSEQLTIHFQAPTGAGKTLMMAWFIDGIIREHQDQKIIFLFSTISNANLNLQNYDKLVAYRTKNDFHYQVVRIDAPSNTKNNKLVDTIQRPILTNHTVYCIGNASFGSGRILKEKGILDRFLADAQSAGYRIVYIRDEAHIGEGVNAIANQQGAKNLLNLLDKYAHKIYCLSATLKTKPDVLITNADAESDHLIKSQRITNEGVTDGGIRSSIDSEEFIRVAIQKFVAVKQMYQESNRSRTKQIRPALLIQVNSDNDTKDKVKKANNQETLTKIIQILEEHNLTWCKYTSEDGMQSNYRSLNERKMTEESRQILTKNSSPIDVIIFKVALATGWDIPRACMLLQVRDIYSATLNRQTLGRIRRNPDPFPSTTEIGALDIDSLTDQYWVYSNVKDFDREWVKAPLELKEKYHDIHFGAVQCAPGPEVDVLETKIKQEMITWLYRDKVQNQIIDLYQARTHLNATDRGKISFEKLIEVSAAGNGIANETTTINNWFDLIETFQNRLGTNNLPVQKLVLETLKHFATTMKMELNTLLLALVDIEGQEILKTLVNIYDRQIDESTVYKLGPSEHYLPNYTDSSSSAETVRQFVVGTDESKQKLLTNYAYQFPSTDQKRILYFDSTNELDFFNKILDYINENGVDAVPMFTKNYPSNSNLYFQYKLHNKNDQLRIAKSYPDFLLQANGEYFFLEIKPKNAENDFDRQKTESLIQAYKECSRLIPAIFGVVEMEHRKSIPLMDVILFKDGQSLHREQIAYFQDLLAMVNDFH